MRRAVLGSVVVLALACGHAGRADKAAPANATAAQREAFAALESSTGREWRWVQDATSTHLSGGGAQLEALPFLDRHRALFRLRDPRSELSTIRHVTDALGMTHDRFQQLVHGVPVVGGEIAVHRDARGAVKSVDANYVADLDVDVRPTLDRTALRARLGGDIDEGNLVVWQRKLAYRFTVHDTKAIWIVTLDANTGAELDRYDNLQTVQASGLGLRGDLRTFEASVGGDGFVLVDASHTAEVRTYSSHKTTEVPGDLLTTADATAWDTIVDAPGAAVDAHVNAAAVLAYYQTVHHRNAIDGAGGAMVSSAHYAISYENAAWTGTEMVYGDGGPSYRSMAFALDVVGHEFTHGVTAQTSRLEYTGESGALNEAVSDIFGSFIEHFVRPDPVANWTFGEGVPVAGGALRDLANPGAVAAPQPSHMVQFVKTVLDNGGVHSNSGIVAHTAYLMTVGGENPVSHGVVEGGIGWEKSEQLWYRANTHYFLSSTTFAQVVLAITSAGEDIGLSDAEQRTVHCAFEATGMADGPCRGLLPDAGAQTALAPVPATNDDFPSSTSAPPTVTAAKPAAAVAVDDGGCQTSKGAPGFMPLALLGLLALVRRRFSRTSA